MEKLEKLRKEQLVELLKKLQLELDSVKTGQENQRAVHELRVHQVELEVQNRELKETRDQLEDVLDNYARLYDFAPVAYLTLNERGVIKEVNLTGAAMLDMDRKDLVALPLLLFIDSGSQPSFFSHVRDCMKQGSAAAELKLKVKARRFDVQAVSALSEAPVQGKLIRTALMDITDRKRAEAYALRLAAEQARREESEWARLKIEESEATYRAIGEAIPFGIWIASPEGGMRYLSASLLDACGRSIEACFGAGWLDCLSPGDAERVRREWQERISEGSFFELEFSFEGVEGRTHDVLSRGIPIRDGKGRITRWAGVNIDITGRKETEKALSEEKERLSVTLGSIGECVITADRDGKVFYINRECESFAGLRHMEAAGKKVEDILDLRDSAANTRLDDPVRALSADRESQAAFSRLELVSRKGLRRKVAGTVAPLRSDEGEVIGNVIVLRDITEMRKAEEEALRTMRFETIGSIAAGMAREFTNLLTLLRGNIDLAIEDLPNSKTRLEEADRLVNSMKSLSHQLLTYSTDLKPVKEFAFLDELIGTLAKEVFEGSGVTCDLDFPEDLWPADVDTDQIREAMRNILVNAREAAQPDGEVGVSLVNIASDGTGAAPIAVGKYIRITVKDSGAGLSSEEMKRVFDPFYSTKPGRSGLGLTVALSIARSHGGHIQIESVPGEGTSVHVYLPAVEAHS